MGKLRVATCQFSVEGDILHNREHILDQMRDASRESADLVHFSESALSGYAGVDRPDSESIPWEYLQDATREIMAAAKKFKQWVVLGSTHFVSDKIKPHNCLYIINSSGEIADRYDKRFCTGCEGPNAKLDLAYYSPGNRFTTFKVKGVTCGTAICFDYRFPELYRGYKKLGVQLMLHSFHNARKSVVADPKYNIWKIIVPATMQCRAAENYFFISANNSTARPSKWASFTVQPDGEILSKSAHDRPNVLITDMDFRRNYFDASAVWRDNAMSGVLHSGKVVKHPRSSSTTCL